MDAFSKSYKIVFLFALLFIFVGCGTGDGLSESGSGNLSVGFTLPGVGGSSKAANVPTGVGSVNVSITGADMTSISDTFNVTPGATVSRSYNCPTGSTKTISIDVYSGPGGAGTHLYTGSSSVDLTPGVTTAVTITMSAVAGDTTAPTVTSTTPATLQTDVGVDGVLTATFSEAMNSATIDATSFTVNGGVTGTVTYNTQNNTATFNPTSNLAFSTTYTATITTAATDLAGNPIATNYAWGFDTQSSFTGGSWAKTYGGSVSDRAYSARQTSDGGHITAGYTYSFGTGLADTWVTKTDSTGAVAWQKTYGGTAYDFAESIQQTTDGGYIVVGETTSFGAGNYDVWVVKLDSTGGVVWEKTYGGNLRDEAWFVQQTTDGGYIVAGDTMSFGAGSKDAWVLKLDSAGTVIWQKAYGGTGIDRVESVDQTTDGGYIVAGYTDSFGAGADDLWVLKLNIDGTVAWQKTYGGTGNERAYAIEQTNGGKYIVAGYTSSSGAGLDDLWVLKLDIDGTVVWQKTYGGTSNESAYSIEQTADLGYIITGYTTSSGAGNGDAWALKLDSAGAVAWQKTYGGVNIDQAESISQATDGGYVMAGYTYSYGAGSDDVWILKLDSNGDAGTSCSLTGTTSVTPADSTVTPANTAVTPVPTAVTGTASTLSITNTVVSPATQCVLADIKTPVVASSSPASAATNVNVNALIKATFTEAMKASTINTSTFTLNGGSAVAGTVSYDPATATATFKASSLLAYSTTYTATITSAATDVAGNAINTHTWTFTTRAAPTFWAKTYGGASGDVARSVQQTSDGGFVMSGYTYSSGAGSADIWVIKLNADGTAAWQKVYGGTANDFVYSIKQTTDSGFIVTGHTYSFGAGSADVWAMKLDSAGAVTWQKTYGGTGIDKAESILQTTDGGYILTGETNSFGAGLYDAWVLKLDSAGLVTWQKTFGGTGDEYTYSIKQTTDGGYVVVGYTSSFGAGGWDLWLLKLDSTGGISWQKTYGGTATDYGKYIEQTTDNGYIVGGKTGATLWALKLNSDGTISWQKTYKGDSTDYASSIEQTSDGGYLFAGETYSYTSGAFDIWLLRLDSTGAVVWEKSYDGPLNDYDTGYYARETSDGGFILAGDDSSDAWVLRTDPDGNIGTCTDIYTTSAIVGTTAVTPALTAVTGANTSATGTTISLTTGTTSITPVTQCTGP